MIYSGQRAMTELSSDLLQTPFLSPGGSVHKLHMF